jgi:hypothetical protein
MKNNLKKIKAKSQFSGKSLLVFGLIFAAVGGYIIWRSLAAPAAPSVYLTPASQSFGPSTTFTIQLRENSGATPVNAIQANLSYPASLVNFVSIDATASAFATQAQNSGGAGVVNIARGTCGGCAALTGDQLVATLTFQTKTTSGTAAVPFTAGTALINSNTNQDILGSLANTQGGSYTIGATLPAVSVTSPANAAIIAQGGTTTINVSATPTNSTISKVEIYIDGGLAATLTTSPYNHAWNTAAVALGSHTIQAKAYDSLNNVGTSALNTVTLADQTTPTATITSPVGGSSIKGTVSVAATAADNAGGTGILKVEFYVDGVLKGTDAAFPYSFSWDTTTATNASHSLTAKAYDNATPANTGTSAVVSAITDNSPPTAPGSLRVTASTSAAITLAWNASTDNNSVTGYQLSRNGTLVVTLPAATLSYADSGLAANTAYNYSLVATDAAGNTSAAATLLPSTLAALPGDLDGDGHVTISDLSILLRWFGTNNPVADIDKNGTVDVFDLSTLLSHYGT